MTTHDDASIVMVRDQRGYTIGYAATCCGWTSGELRDRPGQAMPDLLAHISDRPTETTDAPNH